MNRNIVLLTDFGTKDHYAGVVKGVIGTIAPDACVIDLTHSISPQNIRQAAFRIAKNHMYFPFASIFVCIVDPGVGSGRDLIALKTEKAVFLAPDNGLLTHILETQKIMDARKISNRKNFLHPVSATFHGRDIFAPVAAFLANGGDFTEVGDQAEPSVFKKISVTAEAGKDKVKGEVIDIDRYGNLVTDIPKEMIFDHCDVEIGKHRITRLSEYYSEANKGDLIAYTGSSGNLEIAVVGGNASKKVKAKTGRRVVLKKKPERADDGLV